MAEGLTLNALSKSVNFHPPINNLYPVIGLLTILLSSVIQQLIFVSCLGHLTIILLSVIHQPINCILSSVI